MAEHPILFSTEMVKAILDGRKTQTRRAIKPQPYKEYGCFNWPKSPHYLMGFSDQKSFLDRVSALSPYGQQGDLLWVRETWNTWGTHDNISPKDLPHDIGIAYAADMTDPYGEACGKLRPSIHMPRWASRITLEVTGVRVERVQDISEADAWEEGCKCGELRGDSGEWFPDANQYPASGQRGREWARDWFADLWDSINAERGHGWDSNPWVAAFTFSARLKNIDDMGARNEHYR